MDLAELIAAAEQHVTAAEDLLAAYPQVRSDATHHAERMEAWTKADAHASLATAYELQAARRGDG